MAYLEHVCAILHAKLLLDFMNFKIATQHFFDECKNISKKVFTTLFSSNNKYHTKQFISVRSETDKVPHVRFRGILPTQTTP